MPNVIKKYFNAKILSGFMFVNNCSALELLGIHFQSAADKDGNTALKLCQNTEDPDTKACAKLIMRACERPVSSKYLQRWNIALNQYIIKRFHFFWQIWGHELLINWSGNFFCFRAIICIMLPCIIISLKVAGNEKLLFWNSRLFSLMLFTNLLCKYQNS